MTALADSFVNSAERPLRLRRRPDLICKKQRYHGRSFWVVKEPVSLTYFRFHEEEFAILGWLDGVRSLQSMREMFQSQFAPQRMSLQELQQFVGMLHRNGLVISQGSGQGRQLRRRGDTKRRKELLGKLTNIFALRMRGIDPDRLLERLLPFLGWLFTPAAVIGAILFGLSSLLLVALQWQTFHDKLPSFEQFFAAENWLLLGLTMACVKIMHEFGHGLSCKKFGGECHEMGIMFLVFTPCLYCNVSDSWMLPNKWQRVFIGAAGIYVELILASIATWLWSFSEPGIFNFLCLAVIFICSVSTVIFNGNPLLRFDGYYILMDMLEIPNLRAKSTETLKRWFQRTCLGLELPSSPFLPQRKKFLFASFMVAATIYRWVVVFGIIWFLNQLLKPYGLESVGRAIAVAGFIGLIVQPIWQTYKFFKAPGKASKMKAKNVVLTGLVAASVIGFIGFVPLPFHVDCAFEIQPRDAYQVRVIEPGAVIRWNKQPGQFVETGETIAQLANLELESAKAQYESEFSLARVRLISLEKQSMVDPSAAAQIASQRDQLTSAARSLAIASRRQNELTVVARRDGVVIEPPTKPDQSKKMGEDQLPTWYGSPFDASNRAAYFAEADLLCFVADPGKMEAVIVIDQYDIDLLSLGDEAEMMLDSARLNSIYGKIETVSQAEMKEAPQSLASQAGGRLDTVADDSGRLRPLSTSYQARVPIEQSHVPLRPGYRGISKIHLQWKSLGWRLGRFLLKTFEFDF